MNHDDHVPYTGKTGWHQIADFPEFLKWQYSDGPYRVVVHLNRRGHFEARFTSWYPGPSFLVRGNCGGGHKGRMLAVAAAKGWMQEHQYGCPPPAQMAADAGQDKAH
nr:hypothetical protein 31 [bacterium]